MAQWPGVPLPLTRGIKDCPARIFINDFDDAPNMPAEPLRDAAVVDLTPVIDDQDIALFIEGPRCRASCRIATAMLSGASSSMLALTRRRTMQARFNSRTAKETLSRERSFAMPRCVAVSNPSRSKASAYALMLPGPTAISRASLLMWIPPAGWVRNQKPDERLEFVEHVIYEMLVEHGLQPRWPPGKSAGSKVPGSQKKVRS